MRKQFTPQQKATVALAALTGDKTINQVATQYEVHPTQVKQWRDAAKQALPDVFADKRKKDTVKSSQQQIDELHRVIGVIGDKVIVIHDEQPNRGARISFPGGRVDEADADTLSAAKREVHEETGYEFKQWRLVKAWQPQTKIEWFIYLYVAWDGSKTAEPHVDAGERIEVEQMSFDKVKQLVFDKAGYLGEAQAVFDGLNDTKGLLALPEFESKEVER